MSDIQIGNLGLAGLLALLALRVPIGVSLMAVSIGGIWAIMGWDVTWGILRVVPYGFAANWPLSSIPMFLLMGFLCYHAGLTKGLFEAARLWLSRLPGGLAVASIFGASGFAAVTGSSLACAAAMGRIAVPEMVRQGYDIRLATGTVAAAGTIGALIPPSILFILYGIIAQVPISNLFLGGVSVGLLTTLAYVGTVVVWTWFQPQVAPRITETSTLSQRMRALVSIWPVLLLIVGVFGGLFAGLFTPTEAGGVGAFMSLLIALGKRALTWDALKRSILETLQISASLFIIAIGASMLTRFLALSGAGEALSEGILGMGLDPTVLILSIIGIYLVLGMFLEPMGAMLLTLPILLPITAEAGFNSLWFGVVVAKLLEIGMITPPIGMNVFVIKGVVGKMASTAQIFRGVTWFLVADAVVVALVIGFPRLVLWLPDLMAR
ncbi:TRAP transporter large permease subunit [Aureimonas flava]|uniref:TRAP transporter large permease protein n=1 Tax=Aureimonas flava TaxID=2320271 RepID=A0A3A1WKQ4_9HYPH|nr:TRAP transporter large permease subunit [Aureimonas flava]RIX99720.1 TRAP transporter large permease subunit [Aureimonas flava]